MQEAMQKAESNWKSRVVSAWGFIGRRPLRTTQFLLSVMVLTIVLQNIEPTSIDVLFWSIAKIPKLVLILISMLVGAVAWEITRLLLYRGRRK
jgi:uncharacterized integral membrane protein